MSCDVCIFTLVMSCDVCIFRVLSRGTKPGGGGLWGREATPQAAG